MLKSESNSIFFSREFLFISVPSFLFLLYFSELHNLVCDGNHFSFCFWWNGDRQEIERKQCEYETQQRAVFAGSRTVNNYSAQRHIHLLITSLFPTDWMCGCKKAEHRGALLFIASDYFGLYFTTWDNNPDFHLMTQRLRKPCSDSSSYLPFKEPDL